MLLDGDNEALARALNQAIAWSAPDLASLRCARTLLSTVADVLHWQGLQVLVLVRCGDRLVEKTARLDAARLRALEERYGSPIQLDADLSEAFFRLAATEPALIERTWDVKLALAGSDQGTVVAPIGFRGEVRGMLMVEGVRFSPSAVRVVGQFARLAGSMLERVEHETLLRDQVRELCRTQRLMIAEERLAVLGEAAAVLAHEIRNPLATVNNALVLLRKAPGSSQPMEIIGEEISRLESLTHDLLQLARPLDPRRQRIDLAELLASTVDRLRVLRADLRFDFEPHQPVEVSADPGLLQLALENLLRNAAQVSPKCGAIRVTISAASEQTLVAIDDEGPGIPPGDRLRIFEPFFSTRAAGTGLGLSIVQRIVRAHGGEIRVGESDLGGARFEVILSNP